MKPLIPCSLLVALALQAAASHAAPAVRYCSNCATVESVRRVDGKAPDAPGSAVEQAVPARLARPAHHYEVVLRDGAGAHRTLRFDNDPGVKAGEAIKVNNGVLERDTGLREAAPKAKTAP
ncbi:MAG: hypothetical protein ACLGI6_07505 [Gammaproteobacteria bacterium]